MSKEKILTYSDLKNVLAKENNEKLINLSENNVGIICEYEKTDMLPFLGNHIYVRESIFKKLVNAQQELKNIHSNYSLRVVYGYRHPDIQQKYFEKRKEVIKGEHPLLSEEEIIEKTHMFVASPDVAGHPTGGAVDITIYNTRDNTDIFMGTKIADFSDPEKIQTFSKSISQEEKENRQLLLTLMGNQGFAPFYGEWWHFSYGDKEWAKFYNKESAIFGQIKYPY